jgi:integrase
MSTIPIFKEYTREVLKRREQDGVRGISHEWNRFVTHVEGASFAQKRLDEIAPVDLRDWIREMQAKKAIHRETTLDTGTVKRAFALISAVFVDAVERDVLKGTPPHVGVRVKKRADERATKEKWTYLTLDEQKLIAKCPSIPESDRLMIRFAIATGLRQGEQYNLHLTDLHTGPNDPHVFVRYGRAALPPKSGKMRTVPLFGDGLVAARRWLYLLADYAPENPHKLVFPLPNGRIRSSGKPLGRNNLLRYYLTQVGITRRVPWHALRHTFCTNLVTGVLGQVWPLIMVKEMAGHSSVTISERYAHVGQKDLRELGAACSFAHDAMPAEAPAAEWAGFDDEAWGVAS